jgi:zinc protease
MKNKLLGGRIRRCVRWSGLLVLLFGLMLGMTQAALKKPSRSQSTNTRVTATQIVKTVLPNGLTFLVKPTAANEVVALHLLVRSGPLYETREQRGISALTQQVLIRGSKSRNAREIALATESIGAELTAGLGSGYGYVSLKTTTGGWDTALNILLELIREPKFPAGEFTKEQKMLTASLAAREDQPFVAAYFQFMELFYAGHPYGVKTADLIATVQKLTRDDLVAWYRKVYIPQNMVISIVGKVDPAAIRQRLAATLGKLPAGKPPQITETASARPDQDVLEFKQRATQGLFLVLGYPAPALNTRDSLAMDVLNRILGGGSEARLYTEVREKRGLAYTIYTGYEKRTDGAHLCAIMATAPQNYQAVRDQVVQEFQRLAKQPVTAGELAQAKQALRGSYLMRHETNAAQSLILGSCELNGLGYEYDQKYPQLLQQVTAADIKRVARKYFLHYTMGVVAGQPVE